MCAWGSEGAYAAHTPSSAAAPLTGDALYFSPAFPPAGGVIDTLGAGDTFTAAMIVALGGGAAPQAALKRACQVAGAKCGVRGLDITAVLPTL